MTVELIRFAAQLSAERAAARTVIPDIDDRVWDAPMPSAWATAGFVQELIDSALEAMESSPARSVLLAQLASSIATSIPPGTYPQVTQLQLEGNAWLQTARSQRNQSRYDAALRALDRAQARFGASAALAHDHAVAVLQRAIIASEMRQFDEALALLRDVTPVLQEYGDHRRVAHARMVAANVYHRTGQLATARSIYEDLAKTLHDDPRTLAFVFNNLADLHAQSKEYESAIAALQQARALYDELHMPTEVTRSSWTLARLLLGAGQFVPAAALLSRARADFLSQQLPEEAGLAALDLVECFLATRQHDQAVSLTRQVITEFTAAGLNERAITALSYLHDLLPNNERGPAAVAHVRAFLTRLHDQPDLVFLPLP